MACNDAHVEHTSFRNLNGEDDTQIIICRGNNLLLNINILFESSIYLVRDQAHGIEQR